MKEKKSVRSVVIQIVLFLVAAFVAFWFMLPPIHPRSPLFWQYVLVLIVEALVIFGFASLKQAIFSGVAQPHMGSNQVIDLEELKQARKIWFKPRHVKVLLIAAVVIVGLGILATVVGSQLFNAKSYSRLITYQEGNFSEDVAEISMNQIPVVDRETSIALGKRKLGEMSDLVSQFNIADNYTQINYNGQPVRVSPLMYGDAIKWLKNMGNGIPGYIMVNMTTQEASLVRLDQGIRYSESEYFMRNIYRHLRFQHPTRIFDDVTFEIDDNGTPYWVASTEEYRIGWWSGYDIGGAVLVNALTGESAYYDLEDIPSWVDQVFSSSLVVEQLTFMGKYTNGFFNSIFGQTGVLRPTEGYNYLAINDDVWLYTGMTSVLADQSNVGFVLVNLRTKETKFYSIPGAEEYSAMSSAQGQVQHLNYTATFPLLLNVADRPTYFMSLKDAAGLVKMYAFVDVAQYQVVGTGDTVDAARDDYIMKLSNENIETPSAQEDITALVENIASAVVDGNTVYYIRLAGSEDVYTVPVSLSDQLPFVAVGDHITLTVSSTDSFKKVLAVKIP